MQLLLENGPNSVGEKHGRNQKRRSPRSRISLVLQIIFYEKYVSVLKECFFDIKFDTLNFSCVPFATL